MINLWLSDCLKYCLCVILIVLLNCGCASLFKNYYPGYGYLTTQEAEEIVKEQQRQRQQAEEEQARLIEYWDKYYDEHSGEITGTLCWYKKSFIGARKSDKYYKHVSYNAYYDNYSGREALTEKLNNLTKLEIIRFKRTLKKPQEISWIAFCNEESTTPVFWYKAPYKTTLANFKEKLGDVLYFTNPFELHPEWSEETWEYIKSGLPMLGLTTKQVKMACGEPVDKNVMIGSWGTHEQWVYGDTPVARMYLHFENGVLNSVSAF